MTKLGILAAATLTAASLTPLALGRGRPCETTHRPDPARATLVGWSMLPTKTYVPGSAPSGHWTAGNTAVPAPYPGQPVQGFSATHALADGRFLVMSDNGFGAKANSADFELAVHRIRPNVETGRTAYEGRRSVSATPIDTSRGRSGATAGAPTARPFRSATRAQSLTAS